MLSDEAHTYMRLTYDLKEEDQAILRIADVSYLTREVVRSTFLDDFRALLSDSVPEDWREFDWHDSERDPGGMYAVDCRINGMPRPLFVQALPSDGRTRDATISLLQFEKWQLRFISLAIFEDQEAIDRKVLARFTLYSQDRDSRRFDFLRVLNPLD